ncbi:MAG TPA: DUF5715 family protein [Thermoanaerobaculia bacterium]
MVESHRGSRSIPSRIAIACLVAASFLASPAVEAQSLLGSKASMLRQNEMARDHDYTYLRTGDDIRGFARRGLLVRVRGGSNLKVIDASYPYARPEVKTFLDRLSRQYRSACGEKLVVTSLTRPTTRQPRNASPLSVHPTGMAVDLRRSGRPACRAWLEKTLLTLEEEGVAEATRERHPPHYHVTLFPRPYIRYLAGRGVDEGVQVASASSTKSGSAARASSSTKRYRVGRGDSLWSIARRHHTSVTSLKRANGISSSRLKPGQVLTIPAR